MTEKELLYVEDAVEHEKAIIKICNDISKKIDDNDLIVFMNEQIVSHEELKKQLILLLKENANE